MKPSDTKFLLGHIGGFPLRLSWLPRLVDRYGKEKIIPSDQEEIACELGMGKNMVKSMRIWALAAGVIDDNGKFAPLAEQLFAHKDPFLEHGESIALLHWLICSNVKRFTASTWMFNFFRANSFTLTDAVNHFSNYLATQGVKYANGTIRVDIETTVRMHAALHDKKYIEVDDRFFSTLRLITRRRIEGRMLFSRTWEHNRPQVTKAVLTYAILHTLAKRKTNSSSFTDLYVVDGINVAPGTIFGYTRDGFFAALEDIVNSNTSKFNLVAMPGGEFTFRVTGKLGNQCEKGQTDIAHENYFAHY